MFVAITRKSNTMFVHTEQLPGAGVWACKRPRYAVPYGSIASECIRFCFFWHPETTALEQCSGCTFGMSTPKDLVPSSNTLPALFPKLLHGKIAGATMPDGAAAKSRVFHRLKSGLSGSPRSARVLVGQSCRPWKHVCMGCLARHRWHLCCSLSIRGPGRPSCRA